MLDKPLSKNKILYWIYNGNAAGFTIGEFTSLINLGYFDIPQSEEKYKVTMEKVTEELKETTKA